MLHRLTLLLILFGILFFKTPLFANDLHQGSIIGIVKDASSQLELGGATVALMGEEKTAYTNDLGVFQFTGLKAGSYSIRVSYLAYETVVIDNIKVTDDNSQPLRISLIPENINLPDVVVSAKASNPFATISEVDLKTRPVSNSQELLRVMPGLFIAQHAGGGKAEQIFLRGFDIDHGTDLAIEVDGMPVNMVSHAHGQGYSDLHFVIPELVRAVDLRKGPYAAGDGNFATAGAVSFITTNQLSESFVSGEAGQFDTYRLASGINLLPRKGENAASAYVAGEGRFADGYLNHGSVSIALMGC